MADVKLCKDCRYIVAEARCSHPEQPMTDLVHGEMPLCRDARRDPTMGRIAPAPDYRGCGPSGRLFVARADV